MSNILIIKHGSLGDIVQISGALRDIRETHKNNKIFILTTYPYVELLSKCPYLDGVLIDKRLPRWNILYLIKLKKMLKKFSFSHVYDLQNSSRTSFYKRYLISISNWSSTETTLEKNEKKATFDKESVLQRFKKQLDKSSVKTNHTLKPDFSWATVDIDKLVNKYLNNKFILLFPFCSKKNSHKKWPHFNNLIKIIKSKHNNFEIVVAPGPTEIEEAKEIDSIAITNLEKPLNILQLAGLIAKSNYVISNDTGPAHMAAHLGKKGVAIFGHHTSPEKVSIKTDKFIPITTNNLDQLSAESVYLNIKEDLNLIN